jgi:hypothetical protein
MTEDVDAKGYYVLDKHAAVTILFTAANNLYPYFLTA